MWDVYEICTWVIQDNRPISRVVITPAHSLLPYKVTFPGSWDKGIDIFGDHYSAYCKECRLWDWKMAFPVSAGAWSECRLWLRAQTLPSPHEAALCLHTCDPTRSLMGRIPVRKRRLMLSAEKLFGSYCLFSWKDIHRLVFFTCENGFTIFRRFMQKPLFVWSPVSFVD